jgi:hypothetical protein
MIVIKRMLAVGGVVAAAGVLTLAIAATPAQAQPDNRCQDRLNYANGMLYWQGIWQQTADNFYSQGDTADGDLAMQHERFYENEYNATMYTYYATCT